jgi:hypothetical protein
MAIMHRRANENAFYPSNRHDEIMLLPNLLNAKRHHASPITMKGNSYLDADRRETPAMLSKLHGEKYVQHHTLRRSESFYHDSLESQGACSGTINGCPPPSQQQLPSHGYQFGSAGRSHLPSPWFADADPNPGRTYYGCQETNEVGLEVPRAQPGRRSILKGSSDQLASSQGRQFHKSVRFDLLEDEQEADRDDQQSTSFSWQVPFIFHVLNML